MIFGGIIADVSINQTDQKSIVRRLHKINFSIPWLCLTLSRDVNFSIFVTIISFSIINNYNYVWPFADNMYSVFFNLCTCNENTDAQWYLVRLLGSLHLGKIILLREWPYLEDELTLEIIMRNTASRLFLLPSSLSSLLRLHRWSLLDLSAVLLAYDKTDVRNLVQHLKDGVGDNVATALLLAPRASIVDYDGRFNMLMLIVVLYEVIVYLLFVYLSS